jgi:hypothetical protein
MFILQNYQINAIITLTSYSFGYIFQSLFFLQALQKALLFI